MDFSLPQQNLFKKFINSCQDGDINIVRDLHEQINHMKTFTEDSHVYKDTLFYGINNALSCEHWDILQYLIENNPIEIHKRLDIQYILEVSCSNNQTNLVKYILAKNKEKQLNIDTNKAFESSLNHDDLEIIKTFIFDYDIPKTENLISLLEYEYDYIKDDVDKMFEIRDLKKSIADELPVNENKINNKLKV